MVSSLRLDVDARRRKAGPWGFRWSVWGRPVVLEKGWFMHHPKGVVLMVLNGFLVPTKQQPLGGPSDGLLFFFTVEVMKRNGTFSKFPSEVHLFPPKNNQKYVSLHGFLFSL